MRFLYGNSILDEKTQIVVQSLYCCLKVRDPLTAEHSLHMAFLTYYLAKEFDRDKASLYFAGALTHDIGKIGMMDKILKGSEKLSEDDRVHLKQHVSDGYYLLSSLGMPELILDIVRYHHERYDGSGYLCGLNGLEIPLAGRIAAITDTYSALTSNRPYSNALNMNEAIGVMLQEKEKFDPHILDYFMMKITKLDEMNGKFGLGS